MSDDRSNTTDWRRAGAAESSEGQLALMRLLTITPSEHLKRWLAETQKPWPELEWIERTPDE